MSKANLHLLQISIFVGLYLTIGFISASTLARPWLQSRLGSEILNRGEEAFLEAAIKIAVVLNRRESAFAFFLLFSSAFRQ